jgi:hypothetical protein
VVLGCDLAPGRGWCPRGGDARLAFRPGWCRGDTAVEGRPGYRPSRGEEPKRSWRSMRRHDVFGVPLRAVRGVGQDCSAAHRHTTGHRGDHQEHPDRATGSPGPAGAPGRSGPRRPRGATGPTARTVRTADHDRLSGRARDRCGRRTPARRGRLAGRVHVAAGGSRGRRLDRSARPITAVDGSPSVPTVVGACAPEPPLRQVAQRAQPGSLPAAEQHAAASVCSAPSHAEVPGP